ncbi:MAG: hypothetical protein LBK68_03110 [Candidatus Margulisbacteria bacterium]|jgi:hypothetical protein|nr:hypothetical protein [Candidatus Margulisiibacteriota bacterium]
MVLFLMIIFALVRELCFCLIIWGVSAAFGLGLSFWQIAMAAYLLGLVLSIFKKE